MAEGIQQTYNIVIHTKTQKTLRKNTRVYAY